MFGRNAGVYPIERVNLVTGEPFRDRTHILYVNGQYRGNDALGRLMHDFLCSDPDDMNYLMMAESARYYKEQEREAKAMTSVMKDFEEKIRAFERQDAFEEGWEKGRLLNMFDAVKAVRRSLGLPDDEIRRILNISAEDWTKLQTMA